MLISDEEELKKKQEIDQMIEMKYEKNLPIQLLMNNLRLNFSQRGIRHFIINSFYDQNPKKLLQFLPQLCYIALQYPDSYIKDYLIYECAYSNDFFFITYWCLDSWSKELKKNTKKENYINKLIFDCQNYWLKGKTIFTPDPQISKNKKDYFDFLSMILKNLTNFSLYLKTQNIEKRKKMTVTLLKKINNKIKERRISQKKKKKH